MAARNFLPRCIAFELQIFNDSIGIRLKNAVHLGKKFLAAIFSAILYFGLSGLKLNLTRLCGNEAYDMESFVSMLFFEFAIRLRQLTRFERSCSGR